MSKEKQSVSERLTEAAARKSEHRAPRIGVYLDHESETEDEFQHHLAINLLQALKLATSPRGNKDETYDIYLYSSKKFWKKYSSENGFIYRPFPTSGASNKLGRMLYGKHTDSPKPPEWVGEMLARKANDFTLEAMIFASPTALVSQIEMPSISVMHNIEKTDYSGKDPHHDHAWYEDLYKTVLEHSDVVLVDPFENTDYITEITANDPADITMLSFDLDREELAQNLSKIIAPIARTEI